MQEKREKTGGRKKGTPNKTTAAVKDMVVAALHESGGVAYLIEQARENPKTFLSLVGKVLPLSIAGDAEQPLTLTHDASPALLEALARLKAGKGNNDA